MTKIRNLKSNLYSVFEKKDNAHEYEKAKELFEFKTYQERFKPLYQFANVTQYVLPLISIGTAITFLAFLVYSALPILPLSFIVAALLLIGWEFLKNYLIKDSTTHYFRAKKVHFLTLFFVLVLFVGSVILSVLGSKEAHKQLDKSVQSFTINTELESDSIRTYYDNLIKSEKEELQVFKKSVMWLGKINMYEPSTKKTIDRHNTNLERLEQQKESALLDFKVSSDEQLGEVKNSSRANNTAFAIISLTNEFLILLVNWFLVFYKAKWVSETKTLTGDEDNTFDLQMNDLLKIVQIAQQQSAIPINTALNNPLIEGKKDSGNQIGFKPKNSDNSNIEGLNTPLNTGISSNKKKQNLSEVLGYLHKYKNVVECIENEYTNREIVQETGVSKSTILNVKRCLKTLKIYNNE